MSLPRPPFDTTPFDVDQPEPFVTPLDDGFWRVQWSEGERRIDNVFAYPRLPQVRVTTDDKGATVLLTQDDVEVGRYNEEWAGEEVPCEQSMKPKPID